MQFEPDDGARAKVRQLIDRVTVPRWPATLAGLDRNKVLDAIVDLDVTPLPKHRVMWVRARLPFEHRIRLHAVDALRLFGPVPLGEG